MMILPHFFFFQLDLVQRFYVYDIDGFFFFFFFLTHHPSHLSKNDNCHHNNGYHYYFTGDILTKISHSELTEMAIPFKIQVRGQREEGKEGSK